MVKNVLLRIKYEQNVIEFVHQLIFKKTLKTGISMRNILLKLVSGVIGL